MVLPQMSDANKLWIESTVGIHVVDPTLRASYRMIMLDLNPELTKAEEDLDKLIVDRKITQAEFDMLRKYLKSPDEDNFKLAQCLIEEKQKVRTFKDKLKFWKR